jgi:dolichyl-phosphate-mannose-protein mannosyltransferase
VELFLEQLVYVEVAKRLFARFFKWEYAWLSLIVIGTLVLHLMVITRPAEPLFDEQHYIPDARTIITSHTTNRTEHPPLAKLMIVSGIEIFGDNQYGWRIPSVVFGTAGIVFFYLMCRNFKMSRRGATLGAFILATENLYFVHTGMAMLDIFTVSLMLLSFWLYARGSYPMSGVAVALSTLAKFTGVFAVIAIILHWLIFRRDKKIEFVASLLLSGLSFMLLLAAFDFIIYRHMVNFIGSLLFGLQQTGSLTFESAKHVSMSRPWEWVFNLEIMPYWYGPHFIGLVSFPVWALTVPSLLYMAWRSIQKNSAAFLGVAWFIATWGTWIPLSLVTNRVSFIFYFLPTVPAICFGLAMGIDWLLTYWQTPRRYGVLLPPPPEPVPAVTTAALSLPLPPPPWQPQDLPQATGTQPPIPEHPVEIGGQVLPGIEAVPPPPPFEPLPLGPIRPGKDFLQWAALVFIIVFFLLQIATFIIVAPPLNNWHIENWFT